MSTASRPAAPARPSRDGDEPFRLLVLRHRQELLVHCYRMLGSLEDAEDTVQVALVRAWQGLDGFEGRSSLRAWLYRIATNACLDALRHRARRVLPEALTAPADPGAPPAPDAAELPWLQPVPDSALAVRAGHPQAHARTDPLADLAADPYAVAERLEHIELAFVAAVQYLPARQRAVLLLREVLGFSAAETAELLGSSTAAVNSALQRARATLDGARPLHVTHRPGQDAAALVDRYVAAWHARDVDGLVHLMRDDVRMSMPPSPSWYEGRGAVAAYLGRLLATTATAPGLRRLTTGANRQPALLVTGPAGGATPLAIKVLTVHGDRIAAITGFTSPALFPRFGALPASAVGGAGPGPP